jgi:hypothetical protein
MVKLICARMSIWSFDARIPAAHTATIPAAHSGRREGVFISLDSLECKYKCFL